ncbi:MAG: oligoendopeptidase F [Thermovirga sp.]|nr:oligoendopeptidase F [Thermovirga sp.]
MKTMKNSKNPHMKPIPERKDIPEHYKWKLQDLFETIDDWNKAIIEVERLLAQIENYKDKLGKNPQTLLECLKLADEIGQKSDKILVYAHMKSHEDTRDAKAQSNAHKATSLFIQAQKACSFITPEILQIGEEKITEYIETEERLAKYEFFLKDILRRKAHTLETSEEYLLAGAGEIAQGPEDIFSALTNADIQFPNITNSKGEAIPLSEERFSTFLTSTDRTLRKNAFHALFDTYGSFKNTLSATYSSAIRSSLFFARARNFNSTLEASLFNNSIPVSVYNQLINQINKNLEALHKYVSLKKKALKLDEIHMYDMYVNIAGEPYEHIPFEEAQEIVLDALKPLGTEYLKLVEEGFSSRWIDVYENKGKRGGAYCWGCYGGHPYVLLNYNGKLKDVFTLAHEMGHAIHQAYTNATQPYIYSGHSIFVAEVASIVNEILLNIALTGKASTNEEKKYFMHVMTEQIRTTVFRQTLFAEFELNVHQMTQKGEAPSHETLCSLWMDLNRKYYGPEIALDANLAFEWARIPHFYSPFYVYQYATGFAAALSIANAIANEGAPAQKAYIQFLKSGKSDYPINLLKKAGVDMSTGEPIKEAMNFFSEKVENLEQILSD